jgi:hypothetical protein
MQWYDDENARMVKTQWCNFDGTMVKRQKNDDTMVKTQGAMVKMRWHDDENLMVQL